MHPIDKLLNLISPLLNHWGYWTILAGTILEATPISFLIPGHALVILGGFLSKIGILKLNAVIFVASFGAILGDFLNYFLGKKYGYDFISKYGKYFFLKKESFEKTRELMHNHLGKALIIGRLNLVTRSFGPFIAGASRIKLARFALFNIIGGVFWALTAALIGYVFGASYETASKYIGRFILIAIVASIIIAVSYEFINKRKHIFAKYHLYTLMLNIASLYILSKMAEDVTAKESIFKLDEWISLKIHLIYSPMLTKLMIAVTNIVNPLSLLVISLILFCALIYKKKWHNSLLLIFSLGLGSFAGSLIKFIVSRDRPANALIEVSGYGFPSRHAIMSIIFFSLLLYSFKDEIKNKLLNNIFVAVNILLFSAIGFSRVYLNVHWLSDVIAGFALGLFILTLLILIFRLMAGTVKNIISLFIKN